MFARYAYPAARSENIGAMNRNLQSLERRLKRAQRRVSAGAMQGVDQVGEAIASTLDGVADRFRDGTFGDEAAKIGSEAMKLSNVALRRASREIEARPLLTLAVAAGVGILVGLLSQRHSRTR